MRINNIEMKLVIEVLVVLENKQRQRINTHLFTKDETTIAGLTLIDLDEIEMEVARAICLYTAIPPIYFTFSTRNGNKFAIRHIHMDVNKLIFIVERIFKLPNSFDHKQNLN